jgi:hypothetical protein
MIASWLSAMRILFSPIRQLFAVIRVLAYVQEMVAKFRQTERSPTGGAAAGG